MNPRTYTPACRGTTNTRLWHSAGRPLDQGDAHRRGLVLKHDQTRPSHGESEGESKGER